MGKPWKRAAKKGPKRAEVKRMIRQLEKAGAVPGVCFKKGCGKEAEAMHECLTCEKVEKLKEKIYKVVACRAHSPDALATVKKHALVKHPANLLRVIGAGLRGEEI